MTPVWQSVLAAASLATAGLAVALARLAGRGRAARDALARRVDDLSSRLKVLETLVDVSDSPCARGRAERAPGVLGTSPGRGGGSLRSTPGTRKGPEGRAIHRADPAARLIAVPSLAAAGSEEAATEAGAELGRRFGPIWAMADAGEPAAAIARATGHPIGQVELILGLRRPAVPVPSPREEASHD